MNTDEALAEDLRRKGWRVTLPPPPPPEYSCMVCGDKQSETADDYLVDVTVTIADGEEGIAEVKRFVCFADLTEVSGKLIAMGFESHRHGGIDFLEGGDAFSKPECGGYGVCEKFDPESDDIRQVY